ncbi:MAG TPA: hypothetical protein VNT30_19135 [Stellaceae bacterium]|nr:hypothetical protein [Stellaceae bacterium]
MQATAALPPSAPPPSAPPASTTSPAPEKSHFWDGEDFGFTDVLAALNPLQHVPIIGSIYRAITGDTIGNVARVLGDTLYGGPIGLVTSLINVALVEGTGKDLGENAIAMLRGDDAAPAVPPQFAQQPAQQPAPSAPGRTAVASTAPVAKSGNVIPLGTVPGIALPTSSAQPAAGGNGAKLSPNQTALAALSQASGAPAPLSGIALPTGGRGPMPLPSSEARAFPINMANRGVGPSSLFNHAIPLALSAGVLSRPTATNAIYASTASGPSSSETPTVSPDLMERMRAGLDKYNRGASASPSAVNQLQ